MKNSTIRRYTFLLLTLCTVASVAQNTKYVNLFIGTSGDNGQVAPGAAAPFGMVCVCPDNDPRSHAGYDYAVTKVSGISVNRLSGVGCSGGGGNLRIRPVAPRESNSRLLFDSLYQWHQDRADCDSCDGGGTL